MKNSRKCPKCGQANIIRIPDNPNRYSSGNLPISLHKTVRALLTHTAFHSIFHTLSVKQTHFNSWFKQWECPE